MGAKKVEKRSRIKPFIKVVNYNHLMPTRYTLELEGLKGVISNDTFKEVSQREDAKKTVKKALEERYTSGKNRWFFTPLRKWIMSQGFCREFWLTGGNRFLNSLIYGCYEVSGAWIDIAKSGGWHGKSSSLSQSFRWQKSIGGFV